ncbi:D-glycero-D-manno-heptose 1,7-bisphosphate phosphatase [Acidisarcina polymorpha]|uniref:D,D-heptose 1,7-bisphosphate phosphatase n=1 Tax=Acidisarcina polymorpha TaxID=2211140 RepID=A0A2Z5G3Y4_9BACT|nr:HAD family hydrolase [Acidisarcina polymorpha]AXC13427.1 D-glycero-D-manno-heptose 1,7-bisphosphate phosphatase [Acidisarcina polymorpha]
MTSNPGLARSGEIKYVFLDRDGVINRKLPEGQYVTRWAELELLPGSASAIASLNRSGRKVILVTNQRGVSLGLMTEQELRGLHDQLQQKLATGGATLDAIYYCPHGCEECSCRKPGTGMIEAAFRDFPDANPNNAVLIGDSLSDIECGLKSGMPTIFIEAGGEPDRIAAAEDVRCQDAAAAKEMATAVAQSLDEAVRRILSCS